MNERTKRVLEELGFYQYNDEPCPDFGTFTFVHRDDNKIAVDVFPVTTPQGVVRAIMKAGREAERKEIAAKYKTFIAALEP